VQAETAFSGSWFIQLTKKHRVFLSPQVHTRVHEIPAQNDDNYGDYGKKTGPISNALDSPGFESRQGQETFSSLKTSTPSLGPTQPPIQRVPRFVPGSKAAGAWGRPLSSI